MIPFKSMHGCDEIGQEDDVEKSSFASESQGFRLTKSIENVYFNEHPRLKKFPFSRVVAARFLRATGTHSNFAPWWK